jgi:hypothetical protein
MGYNLPGLVSGIRFGIPWSVFAWARRSGLPWKGGEILFGVGASSFAMLTPARASTANLALGSSLQNFQNRDVMASWLDVGIRWRMRTGPVRWDGRAHIGKSLYAKSFSADKLSDASLATWPDFWLGWRGALNLRALFGASGLFAESGLQFHSLAGEIKILQGSGNLGVGYALE